MCGESKKVLLLLSAMFLEVDISSLVTALQELTRNPLALLNTAKDHDKATNEAARCRLTK